MDKAKSGSQNHSTSDNFNSDFETMQIHDSVSNIHK